MFLTKAFGFPIEQAFRDSFLSKLSNERVQKRALSSNLSISAVDFFLARTSRKGPHSSIRFGDVSFDGRLKM